MIRRPPRATLFPTRRSSDLHTHMEGAKATEAGKKKKVVKRDAAGKRIYDPSRRTPKERRAAFHKLLQERKKKRKQRTKTIVCTVNIHKRVHGLGFKRRAPRAVKKIKEFAHKVMNTRDVRLDQGLNKFVWSKGIKNVPLRVRVKLEKRKNEGEDRRNGRYHTLVTHVPVASFKGLETQRE